MSAAPRSSTAARDVVHGSVHSGVHIPGDNPVGAPVHGVDDGVPATPAQRRSAGPGPLVRHCGPLSLLVVSLLAVPASFAVTTWVAGAAALTAQVLCLPLVVERWRALPARLLPGAVGALSVGWSAWLLGEPGQGDPLLAALTAALRLAVLVLPGAVLLAWVDPAEAGDHLAQRVRLPGRVVVAVVAALGQLSALADAWEQLAASRRARGLGPGRGPLSRGRWLASTAFGLLVDAVRRAGRVSVAMDARGAAPDGPARTWALPAPWRRADSVCVLVGVLVLAVPLVVNALR
ncbi:energy-coupling factor transporter transmembrane protein EcfT [Paenibacillus sp. TRM 82003]|nr:energy-coupling factor transporter transmembrane protein EcfT [Paenibacillus sp. TRM 82003]